MPGTARFDKVDIPASRMKINLARIFKEEGFIKNYKVIKDNRQGILRVYLKYADHQKPLIQGLKRVSKPGRRVYTGHAELPKVQGGLGVAVVSTSQGVMTDRQAREAERGRRSSRARSGKVRPMSRIGKKPVPLPKGVKVVLEDGKLDGHRDPRATLDATHAAPGQRGHRSHGDHREAPG